MLDVEQDKTNRETVVSGFVFVFCRVSGRVVLATREQANESIIERKHPT